MKLHQLEMILEDLNIFDKPKIQLEQYPTSSHLASCIIYTAYQEGNIEDKTVCDLGCGGGILGIASKILGASY